MTFFIRKAVCKRPYGRCLAAAPPSCGRHRPPQPSTASVSDAPRVITEGALKDTYYVRLGGPRAKSSPPQAPVGAAVRHYVTHPDRTVWCGLVCGRDQSRPPDARLRPSDQQSAERARCSAGVVLRWNREMSKAWHNPASPKR